MDPGMALYRQGLELQRPMKLALARGDSLIQGWYASKTAFVTGGSGYLGKHLIEKLIRCCKVRKIYILIRGKKDKSPEDRLAELANDPLFDMVREAQPDFAKVMHAIEGDVADLELGISASNRQTLVQEVEIIFHLAATTRFDETLKKATLINVRGTRELLQLAKKCQQLKSLVHVSTAFSHATAATAGGAIYEEFYPSPVAPQTLIELVESADDDHLHSITDSLIHGWPNTYGFTKAVSEELVRVSAQGLPFCVFRPPIVFGPYCEPEPGYVDASCAYGVTGIVLGVVMGVMRVLFTKRDVRLCFVPADLATSAAVACGWRTADVPEDTVVYTLSNARCNIGFFAISDALNGRGREVPSPRALWYNFLVETDNVFFYKVCLWLLHYLPAYAIDVLCTLFRVHMPNGLKSFVKLYTKMEKMTSVFSFYLTNEWLMRDDNLAALYRRLTPTDKDLFCFDVMKVDWELMIVLWGMGVRKHLIKDGLEGTVYARRKQTCLKWTQYALLIFFVFLLWKFSSLLRYAFL